MFALVLTIFAGVMMVSNTRFHSFKELNLKDKVPFVTLLIVVLVFVVVTIKPAMILFLVFLSYAISGPVITLMTIKKTKEMRQSNKAEESLQTQKDKDASVVDKTESQNDFDSKA